MVGILENSCCSLTAYSKASHFNKSMDYYTKKMISRKSFAQQCIPKKTTLSS